MKTPFATGLAIGLTALAAAAAASAQIELYENDNFAGRSYRASNSVSNLHDSGFNDRASSVIVRGGRWQICADAYFRGRCETVGPGEYPSLRSMDLNDKVSSVRELAWLGGDAAGGGSAAGGGGRPGGSVELFAGGGFNGRIFTVSGPVGNFPRDFNDRAQSMIVYEGNWEICEDIDYRGRCTTYGPGRYANLGGMSGRVSSLRPVGAPGPAQGRGSGARVELFAGNLYEGRAFAVNDSISDFPRYFNDRARTMIVYEGRWEICEDIDFRGRCETYGPGRYPSLGAMANRVSSIRPVDGPRHGTGGWGTRARALLYEYPNLSGRSFVIDSEAVSNLANFGFNDRAASMRVEGGYWIFCTDANFQGNCRTYGPGDYPSLPLGLTNSISSGRRVSESYPYRNNPNWGN